MAAGLCEPQGQHPPSLLANLDSNVHLTVGAETEDPSRPHNYKSAIPLRYLMGIMWSGYAVHGGRSASARWSV